MTTSNIWPCSSCLRQSLECAPVLKTAITDETGKICKSKQLTLRHGQTQAVVKSRKLMGRKMAQDSHGPIETPLYIPPQSMMYDFPSRVNWSAECCKYSGGAFLPNIKSTVLTYKSSRESDEIAIVPFHSSGGLWPVFRGWSRDWHFSRSKCGQHAIICLALGISIMRQPNTERTSHALPFSKCGSLYFHYLEAISALKIDLAGVQGLPSDEILYNMGLILGIEVS